MGEKKMHRVVNAHNAFKLSEYQGTYELVGGNDNDGFFYMNWSIASTYDSEAGHSVPVTKDNGGYMNVPIKVVLGNKEQAIENLKWLLGKVEGHNPEPTTEQSDVPF